MFLKVDIESGKLYFKKSKDGPEDKYFVHNKSKDLRSSFLSQTIDCHKMQTFGDFFFLILLEGF